MNNQLNIFDLTMQMIKVTKPIRLIELFAGYGSTAMALKILGAKFEHYLICEWEVNVIASYKAIHMDNDFADYSKEINYRDLIQILNNLGISNDGKTTMTLKQIGRKNEKWVRKTYNNIQSTHNLVNIMATTGSDLKIIEKDKYCYIITYSFPCTDLSVAGKGLGMKKGSGTRSGLLWEVERLLNETEELPDILLMENVPEVMGRKNIKDFHAWQDFLVSKGYTNYVQIMNAKDYGVAQNRQRCFMVSILGAYNYHFPQTIPLKKIMKDYTEDEVDEKYYINTKKAYELIEKLIENKTLNGNIGNINPSGNGINGQVYGSHGTAPMITTNKGEGLKICTDLSINNPKETQTSNCITARQDRGISNQKSVGGAVVELWK